LGQLSEHEPCHHNANTPAGCGIDALHLGHDGDCRSLESHLVMHISWNW